MDETEHWRLRLIELKTSLGETQAAMASAMNVDASYFSRLLYPLGKKGRKNLGLDTLRSLVKAYRLRADWFDLPLGSALPQRYGSNLEEVDFGIGIIAREPTERTTSTPVKWPFKETSYKRLQQLLDDLGPKTAPEALRDMDSLLDIAVARWEHRAVQLRKQTG